MATFLVHITGNPNIPTLAKVNVREQPGTSGVGVRFQADIGTRNLPILDVKPDQANNGFNGKVYQWFLVQFANGTTGWLRDDLVSLDGDGSDFGYPILTGASYAFALMRQLLPDPTPVPPTPRPCPYRSAAGTAAHAHPDTAADADASRRSQRHGDQRERAEPARSDDQRQGDHAAGVQRDRQAVADAPARGHEQLHLGAGRDRRRHAAGCAPTT